MTGHRATQGARFDLLVRGGTVATAAGSRVADVGVLDGRIAAVEGSIPVGAARRVLDAHGLLVLPGVVDVHTHTRIPTDDEPDRFFQDSVAAAFGGTTTFLSFNNPGTGISDRAQTSLRAGIQEWRARTEGESAVDYGLSAVITAQQDKPERDIAWAVRAGVPTFKAFMVYDFGVDLEHAVELAKRIAKAGGMLQLHCEDRGELEHRTAALVRAGKIRPRFHAESRPWEVEQLGTRHAVNRIATTDVPLYVVHLSCREALRAVTEARRAPRTRIFVETCPHYLALDEYRYELPDNEAVRYVISPPLRGTWQPEDLWAAVGDGSIDVIATDHVPDRLAVEKRYTGQPFTEISNGAPGIETLLSIAYSEGVAKGRIGVERMVDVLSTTPARLFGLGSKGAIEAGRDADLIVFDPTARRVLRAADLHHTSDYTPYEGMELDGAVRHVLVRGEEVIRDGRFVGRRGFGRFQERALAQ